MTVDESVRSAAHRWPAGPGHTLTVTVLRRTSVADTVQAVTALGSVLSTDSWQAWERFPQWKRESSGQRGADRHRLAMHV